MEEDKTVTQPQPVVETQPQQATTDSTPQTEEAKPISLSAKREAAREENLCFICGKVGHWKRECPLNPHQQQPKKEGEGKKKQPYRGGRKRKSRDEEDAEREAKKARGEEKEGPRMPNPDSGRDKSAPKRKITLLFGYSGKAYMGLQRNPEMTTVEGELEKALVKTGIISADNAGTFTKVSWQSCARTDKGVSALGNVVSFKAVLIEDFIAKLNENLPQDIRAFEFQRVGNAFNAKNKCTARRYHYVLPTSVFAPSKFNPAYSPDTPFVFDEKVRSAVNEMLQMYLGTNEYHNFTSGGGPKVAGDPSAQRVMISLEIGEPFVVDGIEYAEIIIHGQSFVLYQIRKMVAMVICLIRDGQPKSIINACFQPPKKNLPVAPALGLFLGKTFFESYNMRCSPHAPLTWEQSEELMQEFKRNIVLPHITNTNKTEGSYQTWLDNIDQNPFNYDFWRCTTKAEVLEKFPTWLQFGGPPEQCQYWVRLQEEEAEAAEVAEAN
eukprot:TRINITY_DN3265_c0_g1_i1.p1 TRINITY_DN3265_c0_g1~~TRINITY_DN3265_c0_g1_i1.p1  ORF type:complete len:495 (-),score=162.01 TRINITY_DN3265_c0_g1_i1:61-1545(-)